MPLINMHGQPIAHAPERPSAAVLGRLTKINPRYDLRWVNAAVAPYWGFVERWREDDPRWARVRAQDISKEWAFDLLAQVPGGVSGDEAVAWLEKSMERVDDPGKFAEEQLDKTVKHNADAKAAHVDAFIQDQTDQAVRLKPRQRKVRDGQEGAAAMVGSPMDGRPAVDLSAIHGDDSKGVPKRGDGVTDPG